MKIKLGILKALCICILAVSYWPSTGSALVLSIPELQVNAGQNIDVPIMIDQVENLAGIKLVIKYDQKLITFKNATKTKQTTPLMHIVNDKKPGELIIVMAGAQGIKGKKIVLLKLTFKATANLKKKTKVILKIDKTEMMSDQLKYLKCTTKLPPISIIPLKKQVNK